MNVLFILLFLMVIFVNGMFKLFVLGNCFNNCWKICLVFFRKFKDNNVFFKLVKVFLLFFFNVFLNINCVFVKFLVCNV